MEPLNQPMERAVATLRERVSPVSRSVALANRRTDVVPNDGSEIDALSRLVVAKMDGGVPWEIRRSLTDEERQRLKAHADVLEIALAPYNNETERATAEAAVAGMFSGFRQMTWESNPADVAYVTATALRKYPVWAIVRACVRIADGTAGLRTDRAPNDAQIAEVVRREMRNAQDNYHSTLQLLRAVPITLQPPRQHVSRRLPGPPLGDGKHAERVAADIAARKETRI